ncbi:MAG: UDP-N-acetylmuramate dehydrogenase [Ginsengibacter sp.]
MVLQNTSLKKYNTFGIDAEAKYFSGFANAQDLQATIEDICGADLSKNKLLILGGGSNILFTQNFEGLVLKNEIRGIETIHEDEEYVYVKAGAGENWHQFVLQCLHNNFAGAENLSLIPGNVGASPMQNIGAYGVELKEIFYSLEAYHLREKEVHTFSLNDCEFGYRQSIFKTKYKDQFAILNVTFRLNKYPVYNVSYGAIREELQRMKIEKLSIHAVSQAVINIRSSKLPDPLETGNAGSFFKNPEISSEHQVSLLEKFPGIIYFPLENGNVKLAAGWLIEQCGFKGMRRGDAGVHNNQALVLVNYGNATGMEIYKLSEDILKSVRKKFNVLLEREVNTV